MGEQVRRPARKRTTPLTRALLLAAVLALGFVAFTWFAAGPLKSAQIDQNLNRTYPIDPYRGLLITLDRVGQRAVALPVLAVVVAWVSVRHRSARPVLVALVAVLAVNIVVWVLKLWLARAEPVAPKPRFFVEGQAYPSGHAANIVMVYGLCVFLIAHYTLVSVRTRRVLAAIVAGLMVLMTVVSVLLRWHWFTDLIGGYLVAGALLAVVAGVDAAVPFRSRRLAVLPEPEPRPGAPSVKQHVAAADVRGPGTAASQTGGPGAPPAEGAAAAAPDRT